MMRGALLKKQFMELGASLMQDRRTGKKRSPASMAGAAALGLMILFGLGSSFFAMAVGLCAPLAQLGLNWLYLAMMALVALTMGVLGGAFNSYSVLYSARDNEFLLAMPIPPRYILEARLLTIWVMALLYTGVVFVPALLVYWWEPSARAMGGGASITAAPAGLLVWVCLSLVALSLACVVGWAVAKIGSRLQNSTAATVALSLAFVGLYLWCYNQMMTLLQNILLTANSLGAAVQGMARPLYWVGCAAAGDGPGLLFAAVLAVGLCAAVCLVLSRSFLSIATANRGAARREYREKPVVQRGLAGALLVRELRRFTASATYMMNCGLGVVMLPVGGVAALVFAPALRELVAALGGPEYAALLACLSLCMSASMNDMTACSVSLEGKELWLVQSLPVPAWEALRAKLRLQLLLTEPPLLFCAVCLIVALRPDPLGAALTLLLPAVYALFEGTFGLFINLKAPNLNWTSEVVPIKQSLGVAVSLLGGWALVAALAGLWFLLRGAISGPVYLLLCAVVFAAVSALLLRWLKTRGAEIFAQL